MNIDSLPNELLAKILLSLPSRDKISCYFLSKKIQDVMINCCATKFDLWGLGTSPVDGFGEYSQLATSGDDVVVASESSTDVYVYSETSPHFYRGITDPSLRLVGNFAATIKFAMIPGSTKMLYSRGGQHGLDGFTIYDLEKQYSIVEYGPPTIPGLIHQILCSPGAFVITFLLVSKNFFVTYLYTWDGAEAKKIQTLGCWSEPYQLKMQPQLSRSGILAYRPIAKQRLLLHHAHKDIALGHIEVDFNFGDIRINPEGSLVALSSSPAGQCVVYNAENKEKLLQFKVPGLGRQKAFTDDFRVLLYEGADGEGLTIVRVEAVDENGITPISTFSIASKSCSVAAFRLIHGVQHLQLVESFSGILRLYKYNGEDEWLLQ